MTDAENTRHTEKMRKIKAARDRMMESKTEEKGLIIVNTGTGKGKSSAGFGMIMRCIAHEMPCAVVQFIKGNWMTGDREFLEKNYADECKFVVSGEGFTWETQDRERDIKAAQAGWEQAKAMILDERIQYVLLDEINIALRNDYLDKEDVKDGLLARHPRTTVIVTGRNAPDNIMEVADLVTEMKAIKHPFENGIKAARGIDF